MRKSYWAMGGVCFLLLVMATEVGLSMRQESPSWDEGDHIYAGYMNWKHGEYDLNPEHPPLVKLVATLPLLPLDLKAAPRQGRFFKDESYFGGRELIFRNDPMYGGHYGADTLLFRMHMTVLVFGLALGLLLFLAGREMFGATAGFITLIVFVFDPTVLANAPFVATDTGAACGFFAAIYAFYRFVKSMCWQRAVICGLAVGIALATKHSTILLLPILIVMAGGELAGTWWTSHRLPRRDAAHMALGMAAIAAIALFVLWSIYGFRYAMHPEGVAMGSLANEIAPLSLIMKHLIAFCARFHLLPESYLYGFADVQRVGDFMATYIFGKVYAHGQWFYFPSILALKFSAGVLGFLALAIYAFATGKVHRPREVFFLAFPALFYLAVAMAGPLNIGVRHVLPVFPFTFALIGGGAAWLTQQRKVWIVPVAALLLWHIVDSARVFPNYLPYANAFWGGPSKTNLYFTDSATDWGQNLKWTKEWLDEHHVKQCSFAYFVAPFLLPSDYGIPCQLLPTFDTSYEEDIDVPPVVHGPILISYPDLNGYEYGTSIRNPYQSLFERKPDAVIANAIAVYYGDFSLPDAAALKYIHQGRAQLKKNPQAALELARQSVALSSENFMANWLLGDALAATGDRAGALAAYQVAMGRLKTADPSAQKEFGPDLEKGIAAVSATTNEQ